MAVPKRVDEGVLLLVLSSPVQQVLYSRKYLRVYSTKFLMKYTSRKYSREYLWLHLGKDWRKYSRVQICSSFIPCVVTEKKKTKKKKN